MQPIRPKVSESSLNQSAGPHVTQFVVIVYDFCRTANANVRVLSQFAWSFAVNIAPCAMRSSHWERTTKAEEATIFKTLEQLQQKPINAMNGLFIRNKTWALEIARDGKNQQWARRRRHDWNEVRWVWNNHRNIIFNVSVFVSLSSIKSVILIYFENGKYFETRLLSTMISIFSSDIELRVTEYSDFLRSIILILSHKNSQPNWR